jgi:hypothetical protein
LSINPYDAPQAPLEGMSTEVAPPIWNPNVAACWSLFFSPVFGAILLTMNWRSLGEEEKATTSRLWAIASLVLLLLSMAAPFVAGDSAGVQLAMDGIAFGMLISWYITSARSQARYVRERFGGVYPRRGWIVPIICAIASFAVLIFAVSLRIPGQMTTLDGPASSKSAS